MRARVQAQNAVLVLPEDARRELEALLGPRLLLDDDARRGHGVDWWPISRVWVAHGDTAAFPAAVARPKHPEEVADVLRICAAARVPVTPSAGRSSVCGQSVPVAGGLALDLGALDAVLEIDEESLTVTAEAGIRGPALEDALRARGLTLGHFPQSFELSTVGGWLACRSAGQYSTRYGKIEQLVLGLDVVLASGSTLSFRPAPAAADGPELMRLFVGSEGTLGVIVRATLSVRPLPPASARRAYAFGSFAQGLDALRRTLRRGARPACPRLYDPTESARVFGIDDAVLIVLAEGEGDELVWELAVLDDECAEARRLDDAVVDVWHAHRFDVSALDHAVHAGLVADTIEVAAVWRDLPRVHADVCAAIAGLEHTVVVTAHCSHAYPSGGCLYFTFAGAPPASEADAYYAAAWERGLAAARAAGATLSHHHGIGIVRGRAFADALGIEGLALFQAVKDALDPVGILNPGKLGLADRLGVGRANWPSKSATVEPDPG